MNSSPVLLGRLASAPGILLFLSLQSPSDRSPAAGPTILKECWQPDAGLPAFTASTSPPSQLPVLGYHPLKTILFIVSRYLSRQYTPAKWPVTLFHQNEGLHPTFALHPFLEMAKYVGCPRSPRDRQDLEDIQGIHKSNWRLRRGDIALVSTGGLSESRSWGAVLGDGLSLSSHSLTGHTLRGPGLCLA